MAQDPNDLHALLREIRDAQIEHFEWSKVELVRSREFQHLALKKQKQRAMMLVIGLILIMIGVLLRTA